MTTPSPSCDEIARKNQTAMLQAFADMTGHVVGERLGVSEATVYRFKSEEVERCSRFLAALGLKCVPVSAMEFDQDLLQALLTLAKLKLNSVQAAGELARLCAREGRAPSA